MECEIVILSKISQAQKDKYWMISLMKQLTHRGESRVMTMVKRSVESDKFKSFIEQHWNYTQ
jgi:hypothetical protein